MAQEGEPKKGVGDRAEAYQGSTDQTKAGKFTTKEKTLVTKQTSEQNRECEGNPPPGEWTAAWVLSTCQIERKLIFSKQNNTKALVVTLQSDTIT